MTILRMLTLSSLLVAPLAGCSGCEKPASVEAQPSTTTAATSAPTASAAPVPTAAAAPSSEPAKTAVAKSAPPIPSASAVPSASAQPTASASAAPSAAPAPAPTPTNAASSADIPKPCNDSFGRLGLMTFTDVGGGKVRITTTKNASASCTRNAATQYTCDWTIDGAPAGSFPAKFDPAKKSVSGSISKGKMFSCPPSSQQ